MDDKDTYDLFKTIGCMLLFISFMLMVIYVLTEPYVYRIGGLIF